MLCQETNHPAIAFVPVTVCLREATAALELPFVDNEPWAALTLSRKDAV